MYYYNLFYIIWFFEAWENVGRYVSCYNFCGKIKLSFNCYHGNYNYYNNNDKQY